MLLYVSQQITVAFALELSTSSLYFPLPTSPDWFVQVFLESDKRTLTQKQCCITSPLNTCHLWVACKKSVTWHCCLKAAPLSYLTSGTKYLIYGALLQHFYVKNRYKNDKVCQNTIVYNVSLYRYLQYASMSNDQCTCIQYVKISINIVCQNIYKYSVSKFQ